MEQKHTKTICLARHEICSPQNNMNRIHVDLSLPSRRNTVNSVLLKSFHGFVAMSQDGNSEAYQKFLEGIRRFPEIGVPQIVHVIFGGSNINHLFWGYPH